jgi:hypothetical protein
VCPRPRHRRARLRSHTGIHECTKPPHRHLVFIEPKVADRRRIHCISRIAIICKIIAAVVRSARDLEAIATTIATVGATRTRQPDTTEELWWRRCITARAINGDTVPPASPPIPVCRTAPHATSPITHTTTGNDRTDSLMARIIAEHGRQLQSMR